MNFCGAAPGPPLWFSQQQPFTTWFSCRTRTPLPIIGAWEKQKMDQPSSAGFEATSSSNHLTCSASTKTSWDV